MFDKISAESPEISSISPDLLETVNHKSPAIRPVKIIAPRIIRVKLNLCSIQLLDKGKIRNIRN